MDIENQINRTDTDSQFFKDVIRGLAASPKYLQSKYFYDTAGDILFQQIMNCPEYYLTDCELEILSGQTNKICLELTKHFKSFDLIELGAGDATKSSFLLKHLAGQGVDFTYMPVDISSHVIKLLEDTLPEKIPGLKLKGLNGEYFDMLREAGNISERNRVILILGANIGNMPPVQAREFCGELRRALRKGDIALIGFDLKKHPQIILNAYNDKGGITSAFNLNLLKRINRELCANFNLPDFEHYATYDPSTGSCKSYLISLKEQNVCISGNTFSFTKDEFISMEISQKYNLMEIDALAGHTGFEPLAYFYDSKNWFVDVIWHCT